LVVVFRCAPANSQHRAQIDVWVSVSGSVSLVSVPHDAIIFNLRRAVKTEFEHKLSNIDAADLIVSLAVDGNALPAGSRVSTGTTDEKPLYVRVPAASAPPAGNSALLY
jgi:hypothetical protein